MTEWNHELEKRILNRSRFTLMFRILRIFVVVLLVFGLYMGVINLISEKLNVGNKHTYYSSLALEWQVPNVRGNLQFSHDSINAFGTKRMSYNMVKKVGLNEVVVGEAQVTKRLVNRFSTIEHYHPGMEQLNDFSFSLPEDPRTSQTLSANAGWNVWETLEMLPEGTVAELAFSTPSFMEAEEILAHLQGYDLHVLWLPLYTGEFVNFIPYSYGQSDEVLMIGDLIGLTGGIDRDDNYHQSLRINYIDEASLGESKQLMLKNMDELLGKSPSYYERFLGLGHLHDKYDYLQTEGFTVYGAVVTGPVKELLKLQESPIVRGEQLGEAELWNWELN